MTKAKELMERLCDLKIAAMVGPELQSHPIMKFGLRLNREDAGVLSDMDTWRCAPDSMLGKKAIGMTIMSVEAEKTEVIKQ